MEGPRRVALVSAVLFLVAGCTSAEPSDWSIATYASVGSSMAAIMQDVTIEKVDGCVLLTSSDVDPVLPVFPVPGTSWHRNRVQLGQRSYKLGERINIGGGGSDVLPAGAVIPPPCSAIRQFWIVGS